MGQSEPKQALLYACERNIQLSDRELSSLTYFWACKEPEAAISWLVQQPDAKIQSLLPKAVAGWANRSPVEAAQYVAELSPGKVQSDAAVMVVERWAMSEPAKAGEWAQGFSDEALQLATWPMVAALIAENDGEGSIRWVKSLPAGKARDASAQQLAWQTGNAEKAVTIAMMMDDPDNRTQTLESIAKNWMKSEPMSASDWVRKSSLPEATKTRILSAPAF